jgi:hypothetical protein
MPRVHHSHSPQEFDCQPRPTRWPTASELDRIAHFRHPADNLMAWNERILADAPVVRDEVKIAVADAAVGDGDLNFMRTQLARVVVIRQQFRSRCVRCKSLNLAMVVHDVLD